MSQKLHYILTLLIVISFIVSLYVWFALPPTILSWSIRIGTLAIFIVSWVLITIEGRRKFRDLVTDFLLQRFGSYFDHRGICFAPITVLRGNICYIDIYYQNRFERACEALIELRPVPGNLMLWSSAETIHVSINVGGAEFGVAHQPYPIATKFAGKQIKFYVFADVRYPGGQGRQLRFHPGIAVGAAGVSSAVRRNLITLLTPLIGILSWSKSAHISLPLPLGAAEIIPEAVKLTVDTLDSASPPTGAFPVIQLPLVTAGEVTTK